MEELIGAILANYKVVVWYELQLTTNERGDYTVAGYFTDSHLAAATGKGKGWYGENGKVVEAYVLTKDGETGYIIGHASSAVTVSLSDEATLLENARQHALGKLSEHEIALLGIAPP